MGISALFSVFALAEFFEELAEFGLVFVFLRDPTEEVSAASPLCFSRFSFFNPPL